MQILLHFALKNSNINDLGQFWRRVRKKKLVDSVAFNTTPTRPRHRPTDRPTFWLCAILWRSLGLLRVVLFVAGRALVVGSESLRSREAWLWLELKEPELFFFDCLWLSDMSLSTFVCCCFWMASRCFWCRFFMCSKSLWCPFNSLTKALSLRRSAELITSTWKIDAFLDLVWATIATTIGRQYNRFALISII